MPRREQPLPSSPPKAQAPFLQQSSPPTTKTSQLVLSLDSTRPSNALANHPPPSSLPLLFHPFGSIPRREEADHRRYASSLGLLLRQLEWGGTKGDSRQAHVSDPVFDSPLPLSLSLYHLRLTYLLNLLLSISTLLQEFRSSSSSFRDEERRRRVLALAVSSSSFLPLLQDQVRPSTLPRHLLRLQ